MRGRRKNPRVSIIGLGNVLLGDDGFGCWAVEVFRSEYQCGPGVEIIDLGTPGLDLAPYLYGKELVIIVDAITADGKPGTVYTYRETGFLDRRAPLRLTDHDPGLQECLAQLHLAGHGPSEVVVVGVIPEACAFGEAISSTVLAAGSLAVVSIARVLRGRGFDCRIRRRPAQPKLWWISDSTSTSSRSATHREPLIATNEL